MITERIYKDEYQEVIDRLVELEQRNHHSEGVDIMTGEPGLSECLSAMLRRWRSIADLSQYEMSQMLDCPKRNIENWEQGRSLPPTWSAKLVLEKLVRYTEKLYEERGRTLMDRLKTDKSGNRPVGSWGTVTVLTEEEDAYIKTYGSMIEALDDCIYEEDFDDMDIQVGYFICQQTDKGPEPFFTDRRGIVYDDFDGFYL